MHFVMPFCQNASSFIERVGKSRFEKLSSRDAVLKDKSIAVSFQAGENELLLRHVLF